MILPKYYSAALAFLMLGAVHAYSDQATIKNMSLYSQQQTNWCWAAITQTIVNQNRGGGETQCQMATRFVHGTTDNYCCYQSTSSSWACNQGYDPNFSLNFYSVLDTTWSTPLAQDSLLREVRRGYPVAFAVMWPQGGGHALLFYGAANYLNQNGQTIETVNIWDPANGGDKVVMSRYQAENYEGGRWTRNFTSKCPNNQCRQQQTI